MEVTNDQRLDMGTPSSLAVDLTGHLIQYNCFAETWTDLGPYSSGSGSTGPTGKVCECGMWLDVQKV
jgi:hypothetical protein